MKAFVYLLALFAAMKIGAAEYFFRTSARDAIVAAYKDKAIQACQRDAKSVADAPAAIAWTRPADVRLMVGKSGLDVHLWQVDHHLWEARYRNPYLLLTPGDQKVAGVVCEYDVLHSSALIQRL